MFSDEQIEALAASFHDSYERQAPDHDYQTRKASAVPWAEVPIQNKRLMCAVVRDLLERDVIRMGDNRG